MLPSSSVILHTDKADFWMQSAKEKDAEINQLKEKLSSLEGINARVISKLSDAEMKLKESKAREIKLKSTVERMTTELMKCRKQLITMQGRLKTVSDTI